jgi:hypothetical protein
MVQRFSGSKVQRFNGSMVQWFNGSGICVPARKDGCFVKLKDFSSIYKELQDQKIRKEG